VKISDLKIDSEHLPELAELCESEAQKASPTYLLRLHKFLTTTCKAHVREGLRRVEASQSSYKEAVTLAVERPEHPLTVISPADPFLVPTLRRIANIVLDCLWGTSAHSSEAGQYNFTLHHGHQFMRGERKPYRNGYWTDISLHSRRNDVDRALACVVGKWIALGGVQEYEDKRLQGDGNKYCTGYALRGPSTYGSARTVMNNIGQPPEQLGPICGPVHRESNDGQSYNVGIASLREATLWDLFSLESYHSGDELVVRPSLPLADSAFFDTHRHRPLALWYHIDTTEKNLRRWKEVVGSAFDPDGGVMNGYMAASLAAAGVSMEVVLQYSGDTVITKGNYGVDSVEKIAVAGNTDELWCLFRWLSSQEYKQVYPLLNNEEQAALAQETYDHRGLWRPTLRCRPFIMVVPMLERALAQCCDHIINDDYCLLLLTLVGMHPTTTVEERQHIVQSLVPNIVRDEQM